MSLREMFFLPELASSHGHEIDFLIYIVHFLMFALFIGWGIFFVIALVRFNRHVNKKADYHGVKNHISSAIEIAVVVFEAVLLIGFSIPFWAKQVNAFPERTDIIEIRVNAEQFAWNIHYPGEDGLFGATSLEFFDKQNNPMGIDPEDPNGKDDFTSINQLYLPVGKPALVHLTSRDVIHSFFLPEFRVKQDAIPGMSIPTWFTPTKTGKWEIACAQLCGLGHYRMRGYITIMPEDEYMTWAKDQSDAASGGSGEFDSFWN